jgi:hypothetical protein
LNLSGSAFGGIFVIILLWVFTPQQIFVLNGFILSFGLIVNKLFNRSSRLDFKLTLVIASAIVNILLLIFPIENNPSQFKSISRIQKFPDAKITFVKNSPYGKVEKIFSKSFRYSPGLSLNYTGNIPVGNLILVNGEIVGFELNDSENFSKDFLRNSTLSVPFILKNFKESLILNSSGGFEIVRFKAFNANHLEVTELNPILFDIIQEQLHKLNYSNISLIQKDPLVYLNSTAKKFDLIYHPIVEPTGLTSGLLSIQEKYLFTLESFQKIYERLSRDGYFVISCYIDKPLRSSAKILNLLMNLRDEEGNKIDSKKLVAINNWNAITFLVKKGNFVKEELNSISKFCEENQFDFLINPESKFLQIKFNQVFDSHELNLITAILQQNKKTISNYLFDLSLPDFNHPYFSNFIEIKNFKHYLDQISLRSLTYSELGYFLLWFVFLLITVLSSIIIFISFKIKNSSKVKLRSFVYFALIGLAFMMIELSLIQKFTLIFSNDVYSITFVISSLLFFSGLGSLYSKNFSRSKKLKLILFLALVTVIFIYSFAINEISNYLISKSGCEKFVISGIIIFLLGFLMGMPFPLGIKELSESNINLIPFAWGINGSFSVISSVGTVIFMISFGFKFTLIIAGILYLACGFFQFLIKTQKN